MRTTSKHYYWVGCLIILSSIILAKCDEVGDLAAAIENQVQSALKYAPRINNSDIYTESVTGTTSYFGLYDFIVVGAGSAGAILAKRLSEYGFKTLLLEAGDKQNNLTDIPAMWNIMLRSTSNWGYITKPQKYFCQGNPNQQCDYPRGKSMGGTSAINGPVYTRGNHHDQDFWRDFGVTGWSWKETLPFFKRLENYNQIYGDPGYHGYDGPVYLDYIRPSSYLVNVFLEANREFYRVTEDYNGQTQMGAGKVQHPKRFGKRLSTNRAYLSNYNEKYLTIVPNAFVHKILLRGKEAFGVEFVLNNSKNYAAIAKKEVIISCGAINSPQLLMLSGIGPKEELDKHGIQQVVDLPVGQNFEDHVGFFGIKFESKVTTTDPTKTLRDYVWEFLLGVGALTETGLHALSFYATDKNETYPDIEFILNPRSVPFLCNAVGLNSNQATCNTISDQVNGVFNIFIALLHPRSKGTVTLQSKNPRDFPIIDPNSLADPDDIERIYKAVDYIKQMLETKAFKDVEAKLIKLSIPACAGLEYDSKEYWYCLIRNISASMYHATGTCRMGKKGNSVVDSKLRVHGMKNLRVADNSVAPKGNSGHTNALAMMIGEKSADIIKNDYHLL